MRCRKATGLERRADRSNIQLILLSPRTLCLGARHPRKFSRRHAHEYYIYIATAPLSCFRQKRGVE